VVNNEIGLHKGRVYSSPYFRPGKRGVSVLNNPYCISINTSGLKNIFEVFIYNRGKSESAVTFYNAY